MTFSPFALTWFPQISESGLAWVLLTCLRFLCLFESTTRDMEREMAADMEGWRGNFGNEIIKQWIVHERDIFLGNSGHILGYANLGYEKAITPKWADQNTVFPSKKLKIYIRS